MDIFCPTHLEYNDSVSVIADILSSRTCPNISHERITEQFSKLKIETVGDLARSTLGRLSQMDLNCSDSLAKLYEAIQIFDEDRSVQSNTTQEMILTELDSGFSSLLKLMASHLEKGNLDLAFNCFITANEINPNCAELFMNLGAIYWRKSQFKEAQQCYYNAVVQKPGFVSAIISLAESFFKIEDKEGALKVCQSLINYYPELSTLRNNYGKYLLSLNKIKEAKQQLKLALKDEPNNPDICNNLGNVYLAAGKLDKAILNFEKALELNTNFASAWTNLGLAYISKNEIERGITKIQKALELNSEDVCALENLAVVYYNQENISLAIETYKKLTTLRPENRDINLSLGLIYYHCEKKYLEAEKYFKKCIELKPEKKKVYRYLSAVYQYLGNYTAASEISIACGDLYFDKNNLDNARNAYIYALHLDPQNKYGHWKLGIVFVRMKQFDEALSRFKYSLDIDPVMIDVLCDCALVYIEKNLLEKALIYLKSACKLKPDHEVAMYNMIIVKQKLGRFNEVVDYFAANSKDDDANSLYECANILYYEMGELNKALFYYEKVLKLNNGTCLDTYIHMGKVLIELKRNNDALSCFKKANQIEPKCAIPYICLASFYKETGDFDKAIILYETALKFKPDFPEAYCNLVHCWRQVCNWSDYNSNMTKLKNTICKQLQHNNVPTLLPQDSLSHPFSPNTLKEIASKHAERCIRKSRRTKSPPQDYLYQTTLSSNGCIRVGYVSSNFGDHLTSNLMQSILKCHDKNKIEAFCYSLSANDSSQSWLNITSLLSDHFRDISAMSMVEAADQINKDGIHLLINMNGYTSGARNEIFALRPAPIQILWLGYPGTSGATFIDYIITDEVCSPPEYKHFYTEELAYMNRSVFIDTHKETFDLEPPCPADGFSLDFINLELPLMPLNQDIDEKNFHYNEISDNVSVCNFRILSDNTLKCYTRQKYNIPEEAIVYCNFSKLNKIDPHTLNMWAYILNCVPNSILWLLRYPPICEDNLRKCGPTINIDLSRIIFGDFELKEDHMRRIQLADIYLDTPCYNGQISCLDAIWAGLPVVTLPKETLASRAAASQLTTLGYTDTIAKSEEDYTKIAINLGLHKTLLKKIKYKLWTLLNEDKLFDLKLYTEELERIYENMWHDNKK